MADVSVIRHSPWIKPANQLWAQVLHLGQRQQYSRNALIGGNGEHVDCLHYLSRGRIKLCRLTADGQEKILFYVEPDNLFGEVPFWSGQPMDSTFIAVEHCHVYTFTRQTIKEDIMGRYPELIVNLLEGMANKMHIISGQACNAASLLNRVSKMLVWVAERDPVAHKESKNFAVKGVSQQELANILGVHRVTLNHVIGQLRQQGVIGEMTKSTLVIRDYDRLLTLAAE